MPSRHHPRGRGHHSYAPIAAEAEDTSVIYAQVDKGKKRRRGRDLNIFNTSSSSSSVRDAADCDAISGTVHEVLHIQSFMNLDCCKDNLKLSFLWIVWMTYFMDAPQWRLPW